MRNSWGFYSFDKIESDCNLY